MSSRRRNSKKNLGNSISDIQRRIRRMERKPIRTRLQNRVIKASAIAPSTITAEEVSFGTPEITSDNPADVIDNPKKGTTVTDPVTGEQKIYSTDIDAFITVKDPEAQATADGKAKTYVQNDEPTGGAYNAGDLWIDTNDGNKLYRYNGTSNTWVSAQDGAISTAQSTANGKNKVYYDTATPGSTANTAGDIWWQYASGIVIGQYVGAGGTSWTSAPIGNAVIANLDAGKITTGYLDVAGTVKITTSATASASANANAARIEISSLGFYAYNGSDATVSITNTGTAAFTGTVNASGGTFTGYVTGGTARFGANVDSTNDGIWIDANNYWYDTGSFKVGDGSESMSYSSAGGLVVTGEISAGTFSGNITSTATIAGGTITSTGTISSYGSNTLTISGGKLAADSVIYLESAGWIDLTAISGLSINADTEITGTFEASGSTLFNGANNQINRDTDVGGTSTKNIRNVWIRSTLVATNASIPNSYIGDIWLQYA